LPSVLCNNAIMKKCGLLFDVVGFIVLSALSLGVQAQSNSQTEPDTVETYLRRQMQRRHIPGMQVAVVQHGKIVLLGAYGMANHRRGRGILRPRHESLGGIWVAGRNQSAASGTDKAWL